MSHHNDNDVDDFFDDVLNDDDDDEDDGQYDVNVPYGIDDDDVDVHDDDACHNTFGY